MVRLSRSLEIDPGPSSYNHFALKAVDEFIVLQTPHWSNTLVYLLTVTERHVLKNNDSMSFGSAYKPRPPAINF